MVGLGYVGLPLAVLFAEAGFRVFGIDTDGARVASINRGNSYIEDVPSGTLVALVDADNTVATSQSEGPGHAGAGALRATTDFDVLQEADAVIVCVPTPLSKTRDPDVSHIVSAVGEIATRLRQGVLVVLESTTYPGTTEELILPRLQEGTGGRLAVGTDYYVAYSPERIDPGAEDWSITNTPKVIGGVTDSCRDAAAALYSSVVRDVVPVSTPRVAEMVKLLENTFRATNIALVNEMAMICDRLGIDIWEVIEAARTKPFGFMPFYPGPGLGGHCIPIDPHYLAWKMKTLDFNARFIHLAEEINRGMPLYWVAKVQDALNQQGKAIRDSTVLVLGVTYKADVADIRESPALDIIDHLLNKGANAIFHDPHVPLLETESYRLMSIGDSELEAELKDADCVVIATAHSVYEWGSVTQASSLVVDTRNALRGTSAQGRKLGVAQGLPASEDEDAVPH